MKLIVIGSNSKGNAYALQTDNETLLIEAGMRLASVKKGLNFNLNNVVGCIISHSHGDHAKYASQYSKQFKVCSVEDVSFAKIGVKGLLPGKTYSFGNFRVTPFDVYHDVPTFGYLIYHKEMGTLLFATDTFALPFAFKGIDHWLLEANYSDDILNRNVLDGKVDTAQRRRIITSHMSIRNCINLLREAEASKALTITLIHLSERNSDPDDFRNQVQSEFATPTYIAFPGHSVNLTKPCSTTT